MSIRLTTTFSIANQTTADLMVIPRSSFQGEGVSLRCTLVDASDGLDNTGGVEKPLGERGFTCVDVGEDPQVECVARQASFPSRSQGHSGWSWTLGACSLLDWLVPS